MSGVTFLKACSINLGQLLLRTKVCNLSFCSKKGNPFVGIAYFTLLLKFLFYIFISLFPKKLIMDAHTNIGNLTVCKNIDLVHLQQYALIVRGNWITGFPSQTSKHFSHQKDRHPQLILGEHSAITNRHLIDCTASVTIVKFSIFAGFQSQILSHSIDLEFCRQSSAPLAIGDYCFVGTNCVLLADSSLPNYSVLGAKSFLNKKYTDTHYLYAGIPALPVKKLSQELLYFSRFTGFVN